MVDVIGNGSVVAWQHINLQGEYGFSEESLKDSIEYGYFCITPQKGKIEAVGQESLEIANIDLMYRLLT
ncbi:MAG: hypothetical protein GY777_20570 [Candidatus Brocadiaceae bacterium]|nr:hypothetical protein [Candidatus Brocadiaceae bacterium]